MIRYLITGPAGEYTLSDDKTWPRMKELKIKSVLCFGAVISTFKSRKNAENALKRTKRYAVAQYPNWLTWLDRSCVRKVEIDASV